MKGRKILNLLVLSGTPKQDGLTISYVKAIVDGAKSVGAKVTIAKLSDTKIGCCRVCGDGWGECATESGTCKYGEDGFNELSDKIREADVLAIVSPVYWGELSEILKSFLDRLRRCGYRKKELSVLYQKSVLMVGVAGGGGSGAFNCIQQMEHVILPLGGIVFDRITINRWNSDYKLKTAFDASATMASGRIPK